MDFEITDFIKIIKQRLLMIVSVVSISVLITGWISFYIIPPQYEARTTLLIQSQNAGNQISYNDLMTNEKLVSTYGEIIQSKRIAQDVIQRLKLNLTERELLKKVKTEGVKDSLLTAITVKDSDPEQAVAIANTFAHSFQDNLSKIMKVQNISILDEAELESDPKPLRSKPFFYMAAVLLLTLNLTIGIAIFLELTDKTIKTEAGIDKLTNLPVLGIIDKFPIKYGKCKIAANQKLSKRKKPKIFYLNKPKSPTSEAFRTLRTNIKYMALHQKFHTLLLTSSLPQEGKTTIIANLAVSMAQEGKKVLLIDCDLRKPCLNHLFNIPNNQGLTNLLINELDINEAVVSAGTSNLYILPSGPIPPNPSELLGTDLMIKLIEDFKKIYDLILIDSSPILPVTDGQILAKLSDAVILVIKSGKTSYESVEKTKYLLDHVGANLIGSVLNGKKIKTNYYY